MSHKRTGNKYNGQSPPAEAKEITLTERKTGGKVPSSLLLIVKALHEAVLKLIFRGIYFIKEILPKWSINILISIKKVDWQDNLPLV